MVDFDSLPPEKQDMVRCAAFSRFGKNGYAKTSIADIAAAAGISKASIFQYFGSKKQLYIYLLQYACDAITREMPAGNDDFFECLQIGSDAKIRVACEHPGMYDFLASIVVEEDEDMVAELNALFNAQISASLGSLFRNVNWDKLRPGIDRDMLINAVRWVNDGYLRASIGKKDYATLRRELFAHLDIIKNAYYKEEYLV